jgi:type IV pilus assembly protein PilE
VRPLQRAIARRGFTLPELIIAMVVVAVLATLALPAYTDSLRVGRRAEAIALLAQLEQGEERWRADHAAYTTLLSDAGVPSALSPSGYYTLAVVSADDSGFVATATAQAAQAGDVACRVFTVSEYAGQWQRSSTNAEGQVATATPDPCWGVSS